jgi:hypothetical protein
MLESALSLNTVRRASLAKSVARNLYVIDKRGLSKICMNIGIVHSKKVKPAISISASDGIASALNNAL